MKYKAFFRSLFFLLLPCIFSNQAWSQKNINLIDARNTEEGRDFSSLLRKMPPEVQFGITVDESGDVYFRCNNKKWLSNLLSSDSYGITSDIVSKNKYVCGSPTSDSSKMVAGYILNPMYRSDLLLNLTGVRTGLYSIKLGNTGKTYFKEEVEGNLLFVNENRVLFYIKFINLDRTPFKILPMGLYSDTLIQSGFNKENSGFFTYSKTVQTTIPFPKSKANFKPSDFSPLYKALNLKDFQIEKIEIRAYSSVEGKESFNDTLMKKRAEAMISEIKKSQPEISRFSTLVAENWLDFFEQIKGTEFSSWSGLAKAEIKTKLQDKPNADKLEALLSLERKAVVTVYLSKKTQYHDISSQAVLDQFKTEIGNKNIPKALHLEQEILSRIQDNKIPDSYLDKLEIPESADFINLLNEKSLFPLLFNHQSERDALSRFLKLKKLAPNSMRVNYNIVALRLSLWEKENDNTGMQNLLGEIKNLENLGVPPSLEKRMFINYYILQTANQMAAGDYDAKNESLKYIGESYTSLKLNDQEIYSLAKYFSLYGRFDWAKNIVSGRIDKLDIDENLLFYFLNLEFSDPKQYNTETFQKAVLNAINLNKSRFCNFFTPAYLNGASIQLLEYNQLKKIYCLSCLNALE